jgi:hypothetical protein
MEERSRAMKILLQTAGAVMALGLIVVAPAAAQAVHVTIVRTDGARVRGDLLDLNATGIIYRDARGDSSLPERDVAVLDLVGDGSNFPAAEVDKAGAGLLVLRNGSMIVGRLQDIGGKFPKRINFNHIDYSSNDVARIYLSRPPGVTTLPGQPDNSLQPGTGAIRVPANGGWVATGITVYQGEPVNLLTTGEVRLSSDPNDIATPSGSKSGRYAPRSPLPSSSAGALIGRVGNGPPFGIGDQRSFPAPATGLLYLTVNDDDRNDNSGEFGVTISAPYRRR